MKSAHFVPIREFFVRFFVAQYIYFNLLLHSDCNEKKSKLEQSCSKISFSNWLATKAFSIFIAKETKLPHFRCVKEA